MQAPDRRHANSSYDDNPNLMRTGPSWGNCRTQGIMVAIMYNHSGQQLNFWVAGWRAIVAWRFGLGALLGNAKNLKRALHGSTENMCGLGPKW
jgi:hypothetical protein